MNACLIKLLIVLALITPATHAHASVVLSEIFADPAAGLSGDANKDGVSSSSHDEFVELLNFGSMTEDISGWTISDLVSARHTFPNNTLLGPMQYIVIFGGGNPNLPGVNFQLASSGGLSLNNTAETVFLKNSQQVLVDSFAYGADGGKDQSLVRFPEGSGNFVLHSTVASGELFSPGESSSQDSHQTTIPEYPVYLYFLLGLFWLYTKMKFRFHSQSLRVD